jgi:predicted RNA polymerase sigma factor
MILNLYDALISRTQSPIAILNRCLVLGEVEGYESAINELEKIKGLSENCHYITSLGEMHLKAGNKEKAKEYFGKALVFTSSNAEIELIRRKIATCN